MKTKVISLVALMAVLSISTPASAQQEEITLSTYYPAPYGEYDELCAEKLLVWSPISSELARMGLGDCHIGNSLIVGAGETGFSYEEISGSLTDGTVLIKGNVGIGTTGLGWGGAKLSVKNENPGSVAFFEGIDLRLGPTLDPSTYVGIRNNKTITALRPEGEIWAFQAQENGNFGIHQCGRNTWMLFQKDTGNVGIGTTGPNAKLELGSGSIRLARPGGIEWNGANERIYASDGTDGTAGGIVVKAGATVRMFIEPITGNVGIGTTGPLAPLSIKPTSNIPQLYLAQDNQPLDGYFIFGDSNGTDGGLKIQRRGEGGAGTVTDLVNIRYNGNVGIGTTNPQAKLEVNGTIKVRGGPNYQSAPTTITDHGTATFTHNLGYIPWCLWTSSNENQVVSIRSISTTQIVLAGWSPVLGQSTTVVVYCW